MKTRLHNSQSGISKIVSCNYRSNLLKVLLSLTVFLSVNLLSAQTTQVFTTSNSFTVPAGVTSIAVECWGAGGAGGNRTANGVAGGGGGGAYSSKTITVNPGDIIPYTVGTGGSSGATAIPGGDTWFESATSVMAKGGQSVANNISGGAAGGIGTAGFGTVRNNGGNGANGNTFGTDYGGGGGSSAGTAAGANGTSATNNNGATAPVGGGDGGDGRFSTQGNGIGGVTPGGGGGGALRTSTNTRLGGSGANGQIRITYTQLTYKSQIISVNPGVGSWCPGETRNVAVTIKNIGTATWTDSGPDINIGIKWNTNGINWTDYHIRTDAGNLAPGATQIYNFSVTASNNAGAGYTTPLTPGTNNLTVDVVYEGLSWFAGNNGGVGPGNTVFTTPSITIGSIPASVSASGSPNPVCEGSTLTLTGNATNATGWSWTGPNGFTASVQNPSLVNMTAAGAGIYTLTASNSCGSAAPVNTAYINFNPKPAVSAAAAVCVGSNIVASPASGGTWISSNNAVATINNAGLITGISAGTATFTYTQTSTGCSNTTTAVTVNTRPTASINSPNSSICNTAQTATITGTVTASGNWVLTLSNGATATGNGNGTFSIVVSPIISTTYTIASLTDENCSSIATDLTGSTIITVNDPVLIIDQPATAQTICSSFPVSFQVNASGTGLTYQWYFGATALTDNGNISGSNAATLNIAQATLADAGTYHVVVTGLAPCTAVTSDDAVLNVNQDIEIVTQPATQIVCNGSSAIFNIDAIGTGLTYQWRKGNTPLFDGGNISGAATATLTISNVTAGDAATNYNVVLSGSGGICPQTISANASLIVNPIPNAVATPVSQPVCSAANIASIQFTGAVPGTSFNWVRDNPSIGGTIATSGNGNITGNLVNSTNAPVTVTFTITPSANGCPGDPITATVIVNPTPNTVPLPSSQTICTANNITTITSSSSVAGTSFNWVRDNPSITGTILNSGSGDISGTLINSTANPVTVTFTITATANGCIGTTGAATVIVNPSPLAIATPANQNLCNGNSITPIILSSLTAGTTFNWVRDNPSITGTILNSGSGDITGTLINSTPNPVTVTFTITPSAAGCPGLPITATVVVNPTADATASVPSQVKCSGTPITTIVLSGNTAGTLFSWIRDNTISVTGMPNTGNGNIAGTLNNTTNAAITVTFNITPFINGCPGTATSASVIVEPTPNLLVTPSTQNVCYGNNLATINVSNPNSVPGTIISWTRTNPAGINTVMPLNGAGNIAGNIQNTTNAAITITFTITATAPGPNACSTTSQATVVLYPELIAPVVSSTQVICSGSNPAPLTATAATGGSGIYTYQWQQSAGASGPWVNVGTGGLTYTPPSQAGYYRLVVTNICGTAFSNVIQISVGGDSGLTFSGSGAPSGPLCPGANFTYTLTSANILGQFGGGNYIRYIWSGNNTYFSSATVNPYGTTNTIFFIFTVFTGTATFTVQNPTAAPVTTNLTITPTIYNSSGQLVCNLTPTIIPVTINPTPTVNAVANQVVCNNTSTAAVSFSGTAGATYSWTNSNPAIGLAASGTGNIPAFNATNGGTTPISGTIIITPLYGSCPGTTKSFTITVNPSPTVNVITNQTVCNNAATTAVNFSGAVGGTVYNWTNNNPSIGLAASGTGNIGSFTALNAGATPVIATITVTPSYTNAATTCGGIPRVFTITVNPNVSAGTISGTSPLCIGATATYSSNGTTGGVWSSSNTAVATVNPATGLVTAVNAGSTNIIYTVSSGCNSPASNFKTLTVSPNATGGVLSGTSPLCIGATAVYTSNGDIGGTWSSSNTAVVTVNPSTGLVTAVGTGTANIIYTVTGCNAVPVSIPVTVNPNANAGVISGSSPLCPAATTTYSSNGNTGGTWTSSNTAIATVDPSTGLVTAITTGTVNITYTITTGCNNPVSASKSLTVAVNANAGTVTGPSPLCIGSGAFYFSTGDAGGTWSSSNTGVATVNTATGFVTPVGPGITNIIYTVNSGCNSPVSSFKTLTVNVPAPVTPGNITGTTPVCASTSGFIYSISPVANTTTYTWAVPAGWVINAGQGTTSISVTAGISGGNITVNAGNFCGTSANKSFSVSVSATGTWLGVNNNWHNPANWCGGIPTLSTNVFIPVVGSGKYPDVNTADAMAHNITLAAGTSLTVDDQTLQVSGTITNGGGIFDVSDGTLELNGTGTVQNISGSIFNSKTIENLVISNSNGVNLTGVNDTLKLSGILKFGISNATLNTNNNLTLLSNASRTASVGDMTSNGAFSNNHITGNVTVERYIPNHFKAWQFLAAPTSGQTVNAAWQEGNTPLSNSNNPGYGTIITSNVSGAVALGFDVYTPAGPTMKTYDSASNGWIGIANPGVQIANKKGYMLFVRGDRSVTAFNQAATATVLRTTGKLYTTDADAPPSTSLNAGTFESIGNPYASAIDFDKVTKTGGVQDVFYVWDPKLTTNLYSAWGLGAYQTIIGPGPNYTVIPGGGSYAGNNTNIESGQAFFVHAPFAPGTVSFTENCKVDGSHTVTRPGNNDVKQLRNNLYVITAGNPVLLDGTLVQFDAAYSNEVDEMDAVKLNNNSENLGLMRAGKRLVAERRAEIERADTIFYNIGQVRVQQYQFEFIPANLDEPGTTAYLEDKYLHTNTLLSLHDTTRVLFNVINDPGAYAADRFRVIFNKPNPVPVTFTSITASRNSDKTATVSWKVENETSMQLYTVERSIDGRNFAGIITTAPTANNGGTAVYTGIDLSVSNAETFYRIKALSIGGRIQYSNIVKVGSLKTTGTIAIYPNPVIDKVARIRFLDKPAGEYQIEVSNKLGQSIYKGSVLINTTDELKQVILGKEIASGNYQLMIVEPDGTKSVQQIMIQ